MAEEGEAPIGHVVHLVRAWDETAAPARIGFSTRLGTGAVLAVWLLVLLAAVATSVLLFHLWTSDSPWWFNVIFTFLPGFAVVGFSIGLVDSRRRARREAALARRWAATREHATPSEGRVSDREVSLTEHGSVSAFTLTVTSEVGSAIRARWFRTSPDAGHAAVLQTQVPAVGSRVRIWQTGARTEDAPIIVEALDPSVVL
ncbi:hypothetical protein OED01_12395 [Microbacterium sp. M28]|uniref:hypothetical protein n=1 Tax=Microbacterium sp. M28 TaxID=2962064 RepID=UPI0021F4DA39|nr:hypothetical protein [Microbacterium sp. M28]UYO96395.1 hypothetical protein OED01_12395 [Microbacterium sp. M28]